MTDSDNDYTSQDWLHITFSKILSSLEQVIEHINGKRALSVHLTLY